MSWDYSDENPVKHAQEAFQETIALKLQHLRRYIKKGTNATLTGAYIEEVVRSFIRKWIGPLQLRHGTFYSQEFEDSGKKPLQIDGIVWNPKAGPAILEENEFLVVHPVFCTGVIEIKMSDHPISDFRDRLQIIYETYMHFCSKSNVMGIVISDSDPEGKSKTKFMDKEINLFDYQKCGCCPIFILFKEKDNEFTPFPQAIESMIKAIYRNQRNANS